MKPKSIVYAKHYKTGQWERATLINTRETFLGQRANVQFDDGKRVNISAASLRMEIPA